MSDDITPKSYIEAIDVFTFFRDEKDMHDYVIFMFEELENDIKIHRNEASYIPPIFYNKKAKVFNVSWNFLVECVAKFVQNPYAKEDFVLDEGLHNIENIKMLWFGLFVFKYSVGYYSFFGKYNPANLPVYMPIVFSRYGTKKRMSSVSFFANKAKDICGPIAYDRVLKELETLNVEMIAFGKNEALKIDCAAL